METEVSEEVIKAAEKFADDRYERAWPWDLDWKEVRNAFIAGAALNKPYEHNAIPEKENNVTLTK